MIGCKNNNQTQLKKENIEFRRAKAGGGNQLGRIIISKILLKILI